MALSRPRRRRVTSQSYDRTQLRLVRSSVLKGQWLPRRRFPSRNRLKSSAPSCQITTREYDCMAFSTKDLNLRTQLKPISGACLGWSSKSLGVVKYSLYTQERQTMRSLRGSSVMVCEVIYLNQWRHLYRMCVNWKQLCIGRGRSCPFNTSNV